MDNVRNKRIIQKMAKKRKLNNTDENNSNVNNKPLDSIAGRVRKRSRHRNRNREEKLVPNDTESDNDNDNDNENDSESDNDSDSDSDNDNESDNESDSDTDNDSESDNETDGDNDSNHIINKNDLSKKEMLKLKREIDNMDDDAILKCPICSTEKSCKSEVKYHLSVHSRLQPFTCDWCPTKFKKKKAKRNHQKHVCKNKPQ